MTKYSRLLVASTSVNLKDGENFYPVTGDPERLPEIGRGTLESIRVENLFGTVLRPMIALDSWCKCLAVDGRLKVWFVSTAGRYWLNMLVDYLRHRQHLDLELFSVTGNIITFVIRASK